MTSTNTSPSFDLDTEIENLARDLTPLSEIVKKLNTTESYVTEFLWDFFADDTYFDPEYDEVAPETQQVIDFYNLEQYRPD